MVQGKKTFKAKKKGIYKKRGYLMRVRSELFHKYKKRFGFVVWGSELDISRDIYYRLKNEGAKPTSYNIDRIIKDIYPPKRKIDKKHAPEIPEAYLRPYHFFDSPMFMKRIADLSPDIWIKSKMIFGKDIFYRGGQYLDYSETFKGITDYLGRIDKEYKNSEGWNGLNYSEDMYIRFLTPLSWHGVNKRWEIEIITCNSSGERLNYGYVPDGGSLDEGFELARKEEGKGFDSEVKKEEKPEDVLPEKKDIFSSESLERLKIEEAGKTERAKLAISSLEKMFESGKITFDQYLSGLEKLK